MKSDPSFVNEAFRVQIPENKKQGAITESPVGDTFVASSVNVPENMSAQSTAGTSFNAVSSSNDFQNAAVNIYDIPQNKVTLNEIKPVGQADGSYFIENKPTDNVSNNLTYSTAAPDLGEPLKGAVFLEEVGDNADIGVYDNTQAVVRDAELPSAKEPVDTAFYGAKEPDITAVQSDESKLCAGSG